ncbi:hypothetical protein D3H65_05020 [Paraflavitalea soli]|uniref:DoxX family protein n=1 Tax=Paraflavitalea soli TaxID=2315862 RepID=A0A3B7MIG8_9BACT|nr:DoxX family protein [Paraflavitalea soli]AXY73377.1 hypothetical protein D3H65_05020 [Paraflavitalea soli]
MYFQIAMLCACLGTLIAFVPKIDVWVVKYRLAVTALWLSILVGICRLLAIWATSGTVLTKNALLFVYNWGKAALFFLVAWLTVLLVKSMVKDSNLSAPFKRMAGRIMKTTIWAAAITCASFYLMVTIGKSKNAKEMEDFFVQSGYPASLNYVIIMVECFFSIGLILHTRLRTGLLSAIVLLFVMLGAIFTHVRNGDPLEASYDAFTQLLVLCFLIILFLVEKKYRKANG